MPDATPRLSHQQLMLMQTMTGPFLTTGKWPVWHYVLTELDRKGLDADELLKSLPYVGTRAVGGLSYGLAWYEYNGLSEDARPALTMAAGLHLAELENVFDSLLRVVHYLVQRQTFARSSPDAVQRSYVEADEVAREFPAMSAEFLQAVPGMLRIEPLLMRGAQGWYNKANGEQSWRYELHRYLLRFRGVSTLREYVTSQMEYVKQTNLEYGLEPRNTPGQFVLERKGVWSHSFVQEEAAAEAELPPTVTPVAEPKPYVNAGLRDELAAKQGKTKLNVDKLIALLHELDDNYAGGNAYSCHAMLRAVIDHVPPLLGHKSFEAAVNNYTWTRTDKKYMTRLLEFKTQADDVLHRQIRASADVITMHDLPQAAALNALLRVCIDQL
ncbi:hypothetical protein GCM10010451_49360 [Streptomyces virens]|uniref:Uncharacterized protein n=1 Tax=Streptomyces virens TaxID=285572 RepID=A0ABP6PWY1_9ACTN|nr:hypothetical protein [Streptomyces calvus]MBA8977049.1 hypothetical protein [Streptomyces calvus]